MLAKIASKRADINSSPESVKDQKDIFSRLIRASDEEATDALTDRELLGNTFAFLIAGHGKVVLVSSTTPDSDVLPLQ